MKNLMGRRHTTLAPNAQPLPRIKVVFCCIEFVEEIMTPDGLMYLVRLYPSKDLDAPTNDLAALVGKMPLLRQKGVLTKLTPDSPDLYFWRDKFWVCAKSSASGIYTYNHNYLLYEVQIENSAEIFSGISERFQG